MKNQIIYLLAVLFIISAAACKKENNTPTCDNCPDSVSDYSQLAIGNYWVYEIQTVNEAGEDTELYGIDSVYIAGDTLINGETYFIQKNTQSLFGGIYKQALLRDSSDFIVNNKGKILLSTSIFDKVIQEIDGAEGRFHINYTMVDKDLEIEVPAGIFKTYNFRGIIHFNEDLISVAINDRAINNYYAKDIGLIKSNIFFAHSPFSFERRLLRYHIE